MLWVHCRAHVWYSKHCAARTPARTAWALASPSKTGFYAPTRVKIIGLPLGPLKCLRRRTNHQPWPGATSCVHKLTLTASFSPSGFRGRLAGPPLLVTAVHLSRRMAIADWLVRCVHIFDDRQRIFKKLERRKQAFRPPLGGHGTAGTGRPPDGHRSNRRVLV